MAVNSQMQGSNDRTFDGALAILALVAIGFLSGWVIWRSNSEAILSGLFFTVGWLAKAAQHVSFMYPDAIGNNLGNWAQTLHHSNPANFGWDAAKVLIQTLSHTIALFLVPYFAWQMLLFRRIHVVNRFVKTYDLDMLVKRNTDKYAAIASIQHERLLEEDLYQGPWAMAHQPIDFALLNELVVVRKKRIGASALSMVGIQSEAVDSFKSIKGWTEKKISWSVEERRRVMPNPAQCRLDTEKTDAMLRAQLGGKFDEASLDKFEMCVLAILYTGNVKGLKEARRLALRLAQSFRRIDPKNRNRPTIDDTGIRQIVDDLKSHHRIRAVKKRHFHKVTTFMGLLEALWKKGIFTSAEFLWLKPIHRTLYLNLAFLGGDRPCSEGLGPWAHYMVEKKKGVACSTACVEGGTDALETMLFEEMWIGSDDGTVVEKIEKAVLAGGDDDKYSPTRGVDLYDRVAK